MLLKPFGFGGSYREGWFQRMTVLLPQDTPRRNVFVLTVLRSAESWCSPLVREDPVAGCFPSSDSAQLGTADRLKVIDIRAACRFLELLVMCSVRVLGNEGANLIHAERQRSYSRELQRRPLFHLKINPYCLDSSYAIPPIVLFPHCKMKRATCVALQRTSPLNLW